MAVEHNVMLDGIYGRHSIGKVRPDKIDRRTMELLVEAAVQAPNHHLTQPWRFFIIEGSAREELGRVMEALLVKKKPDVSEGERQAERAKPLRAPALIAVTANAGKDHEETVENFAATAAAVENLLLAAQSLGLGAQWRTGDIAYSSEGKQWLGAPEDSSIVAFVYVGYPDMEPKPRHRAPAAEMTVWK